jgi:hypothetical protein
MAHDWLLLETLSDEPVVVAQGRQLKNMVPLSAFLRRSLHLSAINNAVTQAARAETGLLRALPDTDRLIRTEPVTMSDGRVHGVHFWTGPAAAEPPERPIPGPLVWDLTTGIATDTPESLSNSGMDPRVEPTRSHVRRGPGPQRTRAQRDEAALAGDPL